MDEKSYEVWLSAPDDRKVFRVWIARPHQAPVYIDVPYRRGIAEVQQGFWVNSEWKWSCGSDVEHWIPPASFALISKVLLDDKHAHSAGDQRE